MSAEQISSVVMLIAGLGVLFGFWLLKEVAERLLSVFDDWRQEARSESHRSAVQLTLNREAVDAVRQFEKEYKR